MSLVDGYLTQTSEWRRTTGHDEWGQEIIETSTIRTFWEQRREMVMTGNGEQIASQARVFTDAAVSEDDVLVDPDGHALPVVQVVTVRDFDGNVDHRECWL